MEVNIHDQRKLRQLLAVLQEFKKFDPEITLPSLLAFVVMAMENNKPGNQRSIEDALEMSSATTSRATSHWADFKMPKRAGLGMMESIIDPEDRRQRILKLRDNGIELAKNITKHLT